jgi:GTPase SAR1 family protein
MESIDEYKEACIKKLNRIKENLLKVPHKKVVWDNTVDVYARKIEHLKAIVSLPEFSNKKSSEDDSRSYDIIAKMNRFLNKCSSEDFHIAFVGTIKTGKSTLINALLGKNYASMGVTPETAALTKFRSGDEDYIKVDFYTKKEWDELWQSAKHAENFKRAYEEVDGDSVCKKWIGHEQITITVENGRIEDEIKKWTSSHSPEHFFVKEVEVGLSSLPVDFPKQVVFVDTPGLSDPVGYRSEISKKYIESADAALVCVLSKKVEQIELETLSTVFSVCHSNKEKVYVIATQWDTMNKPGEDWLSQREFNIDQLSSKGFFGSTELAEKNIMHSAAYIYNISRSFKDSSLDEKKLVRQFYEKVGDFTDDELLDGIKMNVVEANLSEIMDRTNISQIKDVINNSLINNYRNYLSSEIKDLYSEIMHDVRRMAKEKITDTQKLIDAANVEIDKLKAAVKQHKNDCDIIKKQKNLLEHVMNVVEKGAKKRVKDLGEFLNKASGTLDEKGD